MNAFIEDKLKYIIKLGSSKYDIVEHDKMTSDSILNKILNLNSEGEITAFLNHQFDDNEFRYSFLSIFYFNSGHPSWIPDPRIRTIIRSWFNEKFPVKVTFMDRIFNMMICYVGNGFNKNHFFNQIEKRTKEEKISILKFSEIIANEGIELHRKECVEINCAYESLYQMKIDFINETILGLESKKDLIKIRRHKWKGTQRDLGELFLELKNNGWIEEYYYETLQACFTNTNSIDQVLRPFQDRKTKIKAFSKIYTPNCKPMFHGIKRNGKDN